MCHLSWRQRQGSSTPLGMDKDRAVIKRFYEDGAEGNAATALGYPHFFFVFVFCLPLPRRRYQPTNIIRLQRVLVFLVSVLWLLPSFSLFSCFARSRLPVTFCSFLDCVLQIILEAIVKWTTRVCIQSTRGSRWEERGKLDRQRVEHEGGCVMTFRAIYIGQS